MRPGIKRQRGDSKDEDPRRENRRLDSGEERMEEPTPEMKPSLMMRISPPSSEPKPLTQQSSLRMSEEFIFDILSTLGCPPFPPGELLNIVKWKYVDLAKVLDSAQTTELDPKRIHVIDDEVELAFHVSKSSGLIKTASDHSIAFNMYIQAVSFVFPHCAIIPESLSSTKSLEIRWPCKETYTSLITPNLKNSRLPSSPLLALVPIPPHPHLLAGGNRIGEKELEEGMIPVINGIKELVPRRSSSIPFMTPSLRFDFPPLADVDEEELVPTPIEERKVILSSSNWE
ncbi:hypothetical protein AZE42_09331 [Rhizopogon vesiculosus]|uniref:Uncharacterized protein n=1 Tax=Rhizopogon vesiculosus TaxID=180088 RepID=A0A1J8PXA5_9AGAM|nr:hypothetical protein AZE42_09331 [Rhizopogon vesiculosus]